MKVCVKCGVAKDESEFYARDKKCKECRRALAIWYRNQRVEYYREQGRKRYSENKEYYRQKDKERKQRLKIEDHERYAETTYRRANRWRKANAQKMKAWQLFDDAIRYGKIVRPTICSRCGAEGKIEGHHEDYSKPYDVLWLCSKCHHDLHAEKRRKQKEVE